MRLFLIAFGGGSCGIAGADGASTCVVTDNGAITFVLGGEVDLAGFNELCKGLGIVNGNEGGSSVPLPPSRNETGELGGCISWKSRLLGGSDSPVPYVVTSTVGGLCCLFLKTG